MQVVIDGTEIHSEAELHRTLSEQLDFGPYYGNNLAALRDRLSSDVERPIDLIWRNAELSRKFLGDDLFGRIVDIFKSVEAQDKTFGWDERFTFIAQ